jgi:hypothetical protein
LREYCNKRVDSIVQKDNTVFTVLSQFNKENIMKTIRLKEAIKTIALGGYIKEPSNYFSTHTSVLDDEGNCVGMVTYNCYFEVLDHLHGLWKFGHQLKGDDILEKVYGYATVKGDFKKLNGFLNKKNSCAIG